MATELENLEEALEEAEAAARWYAERSVSAATLGLPSTTGHVDTYFGAIRSVSSIASSPDES